MKFIAEKCCFVLKEYYICRKQIDMSKDIRWKFRGDLSIKAKQKVIRFQLEQFLKGKDLTQTEAVDYMLTNFQLTKTKSKK